MYARTFQGIVTQYATHDVALDVLKLVEEDHGKNTMSAVSAVLIDFLDLFM